jgi:ribosomal protein S18 acetylase RimI-like enzyme
MSKFRIEKLLYNNLSEKQLKKVKQLMRSIFGDRFVVAQKTDPIYLAYDNKDKLIGYGMISSYSPDTHFKEEGPYLYNFITDTSLPKDKRCGRILLNYIESDIGKDYGIINLDVEHSNIRAFKFFISCGYKVAGRYEKLDLSNLNLFEIDKTINSYGLHEEIKELKTKKPELAEIEPTVSLTDDAPKKKIVYISLQKKLNISV